MKNLLDLSKLSACKILTNDVKEGPFERQHELLAPHDAPVVRRDPDARRVGRNHVDVGLGGLGEPRAHLDVPLAAADADEGEVREAAGCAGAVPAVVDGVVEVAGVRVEDHDGFVRRGQGYDGVDLEKR